MILKTCLKLLGLLIAAVGLALSFADKKGWFKDSSRAELLKWVLEAPDGLSLDTGAARAFRAKFPPPSDSASDDLTHLTKQVIKSEHGPVMIASVITCIATGPAQLMSPRLMMSDLGRQKLAIGGCRGSLRLSAPSSC